MTPEFVERAKRDYDKELNKPIWDSYLAGYWAATKRFSARQLDRKVLNSKLGYSKIGIENV